MHVITYNKLAMRCAVPITWLLRGGGPGCCPLAAAAAHRGCSSRSSLTVLGERYAADRWTNVTERVLSRLGRCLHRRPRHPLQLLRRRIENHFYVSYATPSGVPLFATFDDLPPVVTTEQSFDSLLIAADHPSRSPTDTYYINERLLLRPQTSAHQVELLQAGHEAFLVTADVYRRDEIDATHYPAFHQMEGVRLFSHHQLSKTVPTARAVNILFEDGKQTSDKQSCHTMDASKMVEMQLKETLVGLVHKLFGEEVEYRWTDCYFPFTHPSWELEVLFDGKWLEVLGCGVMRQEILNNAGVSDKIGWAFGLGLERLAMKLYSIPDIRLFWTSDSGFLKQFDVENPETPITYKPISVYPQCVNDISFWLPARDGDDVGDDGRFSSTDFYEIVRSVGGDTVEQVALVDVFEEARTRRVSHCYRITYRDMMRTLTQAEVNTLHRRIEEASRSELGVTIR